MTKLISITNTNFNLEIKIWLNTCIAAKISCYENTACRKEMSLQKQIIIQFTNKYQRKITKFIANSAKALRGYEHWKRVPPLH